MPLETVDKIWMDGELIDWADANVHILTHGLHYGTGVLEGIRFYDTHNGTVVFRLTDHIKRLVESAKVLMMDVPFSVEQLVEATKETIRANGTPSGYIRPLVYRGYGEMGLNPVNAPVKVAIAIWPWGAYLGDDSVSKGIRLHVSSWQRIGDNSLPPASKTTANYMNSALAKMEAINAGYDDAVMLNQKGQVAEASAMNIFIVKNGIAFTPPTSSGALRGLRRDLSIGLLRDIGVEVKEADLVRSDLYLADEMFVTGTAAEVAAVNSVDNRVIGEPGPVTRKLYELTLEAVTGGNAKYKDWVEAV